MTVEQVAMVAGVILSLAASYIPKFNAWYAKLDPDYKRLLMLGALFVSVYGAYALSCVGYADYYACTGPGAFDAFVAFVGAAIANQATHRITPEAKAVKAVKAG